jgi:hypothetical protein
MTEQLRSAPPAAPRVGVGTSMPRLPGVRGGDVVTLLTIFVAILFFIPSRLIFGPLGGSGTPAEIMCIGLGMWWVSMRVAGARRNSRNPPRVQVAMLVFVAAILCSYIAAAIRPITSDELRSADLGLLMVIAWLGLVLFVGDALVDRRSLDTVLRRMVAAVGAVASLGLIQFLTGKPWTNYIQLPGLSSSTALVSVYGRSGLTRPAGTALHPIEFGAVLTMALPIALHLAMTESNRSITRRWFPVTVIAVAIPISISRSAIISTVVVLTFLLPTWSRPARRVFYAVMPVLLAGLFVTIPGLLGTLTGLFTGISSDSSAQSRTDSYAIAEQFIGRAPIFGRGFGTFLPAYRILDNEYLLLLIGAGFVGLGTLLYLFLTGVAVARRVRTSSSNSATRGLAQALAAAIASAGFSFALFDAFSFPMAATMVMFLLGCVAALGRVSGPQQSTSPGD